MKDELARRRLIQAWRNNRVAARELAMELGGFEQVADWLNSQLTMDDLSADLRGMDSDSINAIISGV